MPESYPDQLEIVPLKKPPKTLVSVPGSKSITNRALVLAALSGSAELHNTLQSDDTEVMITALKQLGWIIETDVEGNTIRVSRPDVVVFDCARFLPSRAELFVGNSGTTMRFLCGLVSLGHGTYRLDGVPRMRERPIGDLLDALRQLGVDAVSENGDDCPPVLIRAHGLKGGTVRIRGDSSSQFLSALLMVTPLAEGETVIEVDGRLVSAPYIRMTVEMMHTWGLMIEANGLKRFRIAGGQEPDIDFYSVEPDASAASYFFAVAAITNGTITVEGLSRKSLQGDVAFVDVLAQMGCRVEECSSGITVHGRPLRGIDIDMNAISDTVMTLGAVACFADGPTTIRNVAHIRHKETDRIAALATELRKVGANVEEFADGLKITPGTPRGAEIETYNDHRMAMSLALVGLKVPGVVIRNPGCVAKTYPGFWTDLERLR